MIVLHGAVSTGDGRVRLWGEAAPEGERDAPAGVLPFGAGPVHLAETLDAMPGGFLPDPDRLGRARIWVPCRGRRPVASTAMVAPDPGGRGRLALRPWLVSTLTLEPEEALILLTSLGVASGGRRTVVPGVVPAADLEFWRGALAFALELVARERFLPALEVGEASNGAAPRAVWRPVLLGEDASRLARMAREMPPSARALEGDIPDRSGLPAHPPDRSAPELVRAFLGRMTDHLVRSATWEGFEAPPAESGRAASPDEAWLRALRAGEPALGPPGDDRGAADLARRLRGWSRAVALASDAPVRLCFRLEEPGDALEEEVGADGWRLELLLQSTSDPSLRVPARRVREGNGALRSAFGSWEGSAADLLLSSLGQAVAVSPVVEAALERPDADAVALDAEAAYRFLTEDAGALEQAGFSILLPAWWARRERAPGPELRARADSPPAPPTGLFALEALVRVHWEAVLGGEVLSREELERLAALKVPLIRMRGEWIHVDREAIRRILERVERPTEERVRDLLRRGLGEGDGPGEVETSALRATGWVAELLETLRRAASGGGPGGPPDTAPGAPGDPSTGPGGTSVEEGGIPAPAAFRGTLRPYQRRGYAWLASLRRWGLGACLADDMGLGKTIQALALVQRDREVRADPGPVLLVCPTSVITNWRREAERFTPDLDVLVHHGPDRGAGEALADAAALHALVVTSYGLLLRDAADLGRVRWEGVILDEAQNIKNPETKQARAARSMEAGYRVALTGTPVENHVGDLWSLMEFLNPGLLGSRAAFRRRFLVPIQARGDRTATERLRRVTAPFVLRRAKTDPAILPELPDKIERRQYCTLTPEQATLYRAVLADAEEKLEAAGGDDMGRRGLILGLLTRLKQVCNHPAHLLGDGSPVPGRSGKLERLTALAEEVLESEERALIFTQYVEMGEMLQRHLEETFGREAPFLHGGVTRRRRDEMVERFQEGRADGPAFFLLSLRAGGTGLNLTAASHVFHYDRWWNPAVEDQATDRAYRIGQRRNVQVHKLVCTGTLEERIDDMIESKKEVARAVVGGGEAWITELDDARLRELLALSDEAVEDAGEGA